MDDYKISNFVEIACTWLTVYLILNKTGAEYSDAAIIAELTSIHYTILEAAARLYSVGQ